LNSAAVGSRSGKEAGEILQTYIETMPVLAFGSVPGAAAEINSKDTGAGDQFIKPR